MKKNFIASLILAFVVTLNLFGCSTSQPNDTSMTQGSPTLESVVQKGEEDDKDFPNTFEGYRLIEIDGGDLSGHREPNIVIDIGFGDRDYWAFTNEYGQLVKVTAKEIILQDDSTEPVTSEGRYYRDEAKVPGVESKDLDEGHIIADSLGGVSNAYNITPQNSTLNRHGDQAYMEKVIRDAGGCTDFEAVITYPNNETQIPSHYSYTYTINGNVIKEEFDNINPEEGSSPSDSNNNVTITAGNDYLDNVYWTPSGKSHHKSRDCSTLSRSKTVLEGSVSESGKSDPCNICN